MRLLVANANTTQGITDLCAASARAVAAPGTEVVPATPRFGPAVISSRVENVVAGHALLELLAEHAGQVDAVVLAVSHDTALEAARQLMPCPVVAMTEAACMTACLVGGRFGLVTFGSTETYRELIARHGLSARCSGLLGVGSTPQDVLRDPDGVAAKVLGGVRELAAAGADSIVLGGAALAGMDQRIGAESPVPLIDGIACATKLAEGLVALGLPKPRTGSFAAPTGRVTTGLSPALAALLKG